MKGEAADARSILEIYDLEQVAYRSVWNLQKQLQEALIQQKRNPEHTQYTDKDLADMLLFVEHPHVYTLGKSGDLKNLLIDGQKRKEKNISFYKINRGGDITYHGPGQLVVYPILDLDYFFSDIHKYLRLLEESVILTLADYGVAGQRLDGFTGVWVDAEKETPRNICAIGVKCSRWVTMH